MSLSEAFADEHAVTAGPAGRLPCPPGLTDIAAFDDVEQPASHPIAIAEPDFGHLYGRSPVMRALFDQIGKVSAVGVGMRSHPGVSATFFRALAEADVNLQMISTSEIRISVIVGADDVDAAVRASHTAFGLDAEETATVYAGTGR